MFSPWNRLNKKKSQLQDWEYKIIIKNIIEQIIPKHQIIKKVHFHLFTSNKKLF